MTILIVLGCLIDRQKDQFGPDLRILKTFVVFEKPKQVYFWEFQKFQR